MKANQNEAPPAKPRADRQHGPRHHGRGYVRRGRSAGTQGGELADTSLPSVTRIATLERSAGTTGGELEDIIRGFAAERQNLLVAGPERLVREERAKLEAGKARVVTALRELKSEADALRSGYLEMQDIQRRITLFEAACDPVHRREINKAVDTLKVTVGFGTLPTRTIMRVGVREARSQAEQLKWELTRRAARLPTTFATLYREIEAHPEAHRIDHGFVSQLKIYQEKLGKLVADLPMSTSNRIVAFFARHALYGYARALSITVSAHLSKEEHSTVDFAAERAAESRKKELGGEFAALGLRFDRAVRDLAVRERLEQKTAGRLLIVAHLLDGRGSGEEQLQGWLKKVTGERLEEVAATLSGLERDQSISKADSFRVADAITRFLAESRPIPRQKARHGDTPDQPAAVLPPETAALIEGNRSSPLAQRLSRIYRDAPQHGGQVTAFLKDLSADALAAARELAGHRNAWEEVTRLIATEYERAWEILELLGEAHVEGRPVYPEFQRTLNGSKADPLRSVPLPGLSADDADVVAKVRSYAVDRIVILSAHPIVGEAARRLNAAAHPLALETLQDRHSRLPMTGEYWIAVTSAMSHKDLWSLLGAARDARSRGDDQPVLMVGNQCGYSTLERAVRRINELKC